MPGIEQKQRNEARNTSLNSLPGQTFNGAAEDSTRGSDRGNQARIGRRAELTRIARIRESIVLKRRSTMSQPFEESKAEKLKDEIVSDESPAKKIEHVAEKEAEKSTKTVQKYDSNNNQLFSK
jgi:carbonic anhydrase/acetyltransferase-like protein (isoleucine patch superfamily)